MADTYYKIATVTVGAGGASSMDFTSIPSTYTDLVIKSSGRVSTAGIGNEFQLRFNSDSGANYNWIRIYSDGGTVYSQKGSTIGSPYTSFILAGGINGTSSTSSTFSNSEIYIPNYTGSAYKTTSSDSVVENNSASAYLYLTAGIWNNTAAITSISLVGDYVQYSTATLYGIKNS